MASAKCHRTRDRVCLQFCYKITFSELSKPISSCAGTSTAPEEQQGGHRQERGMEWNGMEWNGMEWNGMEWNGMEWSGIFPWKGSTTAAGFKNSTTAIRADTQPLFLRNEWDKSHGTMELFRLEKPGYIPWNHGAVQVRKARIHPMEPWSCSGQKSQDTSHGTMELFGSEKPGYIPWNHGAVQAGKARIHPMEPWSCSGRKARIHPMEPWSCSCWKSQDTSHGTMELFRLEKPGYIPWNHGAVQVRKARIHPMEPWSCSGQKSQDTSHGTMELFRLEKPGYIPWNHGAVHVGKARIHPMEPWSCSGQKSQDTSHGTMELGLQQVLKDSGSLGSVEFLWLPKEALPALLLPKIKTI
ncbi:uncharacterized protein LOC115906379 [Camarhynchus parvulus]|uniref:uncharacterized protein LOC115906379 n=1 Tax=Geospiza parvula TaxID=87175 RepID=UPI0012381C7E|nr:uncharacterized protein LOC115906379 [Camarhynchus parvulus]